MNGNLFDDPAGSAGSAAEEWFTAHCDGGSRGNPGPSGYGAVVEDAQGRVVAELSEFLGNQTNNYAEYHGLLAVLAWAVEHGAKRLCVISDSELMVKQMQGKYKVNSPGLRPLWEEARKLSRRLERFEMRHTLRGGNKEADRLANEAMDRGMGRPVGEPVSQRVSGSPSQQVSKSAGFAGRPAEQAVASRPAPPPAAKPARQILEGYVKDGVVHLLGGELPDGIFVKIIRE
ncbi:MAG: ribonuclease HI family protein [Terracidiphilus sp.]|nr:ribonuclease HI family protein [Terracidiphilus sp.]MDR3776794.1 ribonuclease HI family protein [Terracidiphilus sp.]